ncbi:MAG: V4R domain-containing protein [Oscillospiraceae bacterium]
MADLSKLQTADVFSWSLLGDIKNARAGLGDTMPVAVYRLFEYTMRETLIEALSKNAAIALFREAGRKAGFHFAENMLDALKEKAEFIEELQEKFVEMKIGVLRVESIDANGTMILTISEDLDCSGLPIVGETVCNYDEGFLAGVFQQHYKKRFCAIETDCWAKGDRVCRFKVQQAIGEENAKEGKI